MQLREWCAAVALEISALAGVVAWAGPALWEAPQVRHMWRITEVLQREAAGRGAAAGTRRGEDWIFPLKDECVHALRTTAELVGALQVCRHDHHLRHAPGLQRWRNIRFPAWILYCS